MTTTTSTTSVHTAKSTTQPWTVAPLPVAAKPSGREHRRRDFGVGYGNSSGYASGKRYADNWGNVRFRCG
jgi:hypothetical protein